MHGERLPLVLIAAVARNGVIGTGNALPWRLPSDMRHFKAATMGKPVVMGRKTFESIGGPLPGRSVIVVSRDEGWRAPGVRVATNLDAALTLAETVGQDLDAGAVMIAGGGMLYAALIARADRLSITEVDLAPLGEVRFPAIDAALWRETSRVTPARGERDEAPFAFVTYARA